MKRRLCTRFADEFYAQHFKLSGPLYDKLSYDLYDMQGQLNDLFYKLREELSK